MFYDPVKIFQNVVRFGILGTMLIGVSCFMIYWTFNYIGPDTNSSQAAIPIMFGVAGSHYLVASAKIFLENRGHFWEI